MTQKYKYHEQEVSLIDKEKYPHLKDVKKCYIATFLEKELYVIHIANPKKGLTHLRIRRLDRLPINNWELIQSIKNDLLGVDSIAIEIYPKESELINFGPTRHIWTWDNIEDFALPNLKELYTYKS